MSRIGRLPVPVPAGVDVTIDGQDVTVKGPKGTLSRTISEPLSVTRQEDGSILVTRPDAARRSRSLPGLSRTSPRATPSSSRSSAQVTASPQRARASSSPSASPTP